MSYEVLIDGATIPKALSKLQDNTGTDMGYQHLGKVYRKGEIIADDDVSPVIKEAYDNGDPHTLTLLKKTSDEPNVKGPGGDADVNLEHTMGPETGSPGVIMPDKAAIVAEAQAAVGEADQPLAAGVSEKGQKQLEEDDWKPATGSATYEPAASDQTPAEKEEAAKEAEAAAKEADKKAKAAAKEADKDTKAESKKS